jgi:NAD(P)H-dependent FMN reductase
MNERNVHMKLNVIIGSTRPGRAGPAIGKWFADLARGHGRFEVELVDLDAFKLPLLDEAAHPILQQYEHEHTKAWSRSVNSADAYVLLTPEYDYFPPASLVNAVQVLVREWSYKPVGVVSYGGISGGLRAAQELRLLISSVNAHPLPQTVPVPLFGQFIDDAGTFSGNETIAQGATVMLDELFKWAGPLRQMRQAA